MNAIIVKIRPNEHTGRFEVICSDPECENADVETKGMAIESKEWHIKWHSRKLPWPK